MKVVGFFCVVVLVFFAVSLSFVFPRFHYSTAYWLIRTLSFNKKYLHGWAALFFIDRPTRNASNSTNGLNPKSSYLRLRNYTDS